MSVSKRFVTKNGLDNNGNSITNIGVSGASLTQAGANALTLTTTGPTNVTFPTSGTLATTAGSTTTAINLSGGAAGSVPYQSSASNTAFLAAGTSSQVLISGASSPAWTNTPTLTGTNFTGIPNSGLTNSSVTIGSTAISLGATSTTLAGLTSVTSTAFTGALTGAASLNVLKTGDTMTGNLSVTSAASSSLISATATAGNTASLELAGAGNTIGATGFLIRQDTASGALLFNRANAPMTFSTNSALRMTISATGLVGIGQTPVTNALEVNGAVSATSFIGPLTGHASSDLALSGGTMTGAINLGGFVATNGGTPVSGTDIVNKNYVDAAITGLEWKASAAASTTTALTVTYSNGTSGVGATLTNAGTQAAFAVDGYTASLNDRILVKNQASALQNGIYSVTTVGSGATNWVLTRTTDADVSAELNNATLYITHGTTLSDTGWTQITANPTIGTSNITFNQFSGAGTYVAGTGLSLTGNTFANTGVTSFTSNTGLSTNTSATGAVTVTNTGVTSAVAGTNIAVSGATGAVTISVTGTVPTATTATNIAGGAAGNIHYQSGAGATALLATGTSSQVLVSGTTPAWTNTPTLTGTNFTGIPNGALTNSSITVNGTGISLGGSGTVTASAGTLTGTTLNSTVTASSLTSVGTLGSLTVTGTASAGTFSGAGTNLTGTAASLTAGNVNNISNALGGSYTWTGGFNYFTSPLNCTVGQASQASGMMAYSNGGAAAISFHRPAVYAINMGIDTDNVLRVGGWSDGLNVYRWTSDTSGNFVARGTITGTTINGAGTGLTGTASSLSIGGNAATATTATTATNQSGGTVNATTGTFSGKVAINNGSTGVGSSSALFLNGGDITTARSSTTGVLYLGTSGNNYLYWDSTSYIFGGASVSIVASTGTINCSALTATGDVTAFSDIRVKDNILIIDNALSKVEKLRGVTFTRTDDAHFGKKQTGVIAQEVQEVLPEVIHENEDGMLSVAYGNMVGLLIESIKELSAQNKDLLARIQILEGKN